MADVTSATKIDPLENLFPPLSGAESPKGSSAPLLIRDANETDLDWLVVQLREFSKFNDTKYPMFSDEAEVRAKMLGIIQNHFVRIATREDDRMGFIAGYYVRHPFNDALITLCELFWWVAPEYRRSTAGIRLLDAYVDWGRENANWITFALQTHSPVKEEALLRRGFHRHETNFLLEVL